MEYIYYEQIKNWQEDWSKYWNSLSEEQKMKLIEPIGYILTAKEIEKVFIKAGDQ